MNNDESRKLPEGGSVEGGPGVADTRRRFLRGETSSAETARLVQAALRTAGGPEDEPAAAPTAWTPAATEPAHYEAALAAAGARTPDLAAKVETDEARAEARVEELLAATNGEELAVSDPRFRTWAVGRALRRASQRACGSRPVRAVLLARLAVSAAGASLAAACGPEDEATEVDTAAATLGATPFASADARLAADLAALAWGQLANAQRVASDLRGAEQALRVAFAHAGRGTRDRLVRARLESWATTLRIDQSRFPEATSLARRAARRYRAAGDLHAYGRTLLKQARIQALTEDLDGACATLLEALGHVDPHMEPRLAAVAHNNFASYLERMGRPEEAEQQLDTVEELLLQLESSGEARPLDRARLTWMRGRVAASRGDREVGEVSLSRARREFVEAGLAFEASQVALELALLYAETGRMADQRRLAEEMLPIFTSRDLHAEARAALALYTEAARAQAVGTGLVRDLTRYLDRSRHRPGLRFEHV